MKEDDVRVLVESRLGQARTALDDARYLIAGNRSSQAIVNRLYYAMFYAALALLQRSGSVPSKHAGALTLFDREFVLAGKLPKELSRAFHRAFELRQASDYHTGRPLSSEAIDELAAGAAAFVDGVAQFLAKDLGTG
jgi:uncharacterized protein (UPF0332 family)